MNLDLGIKLIRESVGKDMPAIITIIRNFRVHNNDNNNQ